MKDETEPKLWQGHGEYLGELNEGAFNWPKNVPPITIIQPDHFEDDEPCGYCERPVGQAHETWCRQ